MDTLKFKTLLFLTFFSLKSLAQTISVDTLLNEKISVRAIAIDGNSVWYAADKGRFGKIDTEKHTREKKQVFMDTLKIEFRSIGQTDNDIFIVNIGNPALLYKISKANMQERLVYQEKHEKVFYDSMQFWNDREGIAIGDPTENCFSILITRDGGNSWQKTPCSNLPKLIDGEAAFASSNTNIIIKGDKTWIVSGGKKARVFFSSDKGKTWTVADTPIVQGKSMTGIFTADFYDENIGIIAGGDYDIQNQNFGNKAVTNDGGKTWKPIAENNGFGYASCIQYVPNGNGKELVCVGGTGIHYSSDSGKSWNKLSDDKDYYTIRFIDSTTAIAAGRNKLVRLKFIK
jgi:photosystem II stability/assembly factor-like uncharacterized protein